MPQYNYRAMNAQGRQIRGQLNAANDSELFQQLQESGMQLIDCSVVRQRRLTVAVSRPPKTRDLIQLCVHLEQLQKAGVPLLEGLADVRDSTEQPKLRDILSEVYRDVSEGESLSEAFAKHPKVFGSVFTALLAAGEESGNLTESFSQLVKHLKWTDSVNNKVRKAVRYPAFIITMITGLFFFMMLFVVPEVVQFLITTGGELPAITRSLIATSDFVQNRWYVILLTPIAVFMLIKTAIRLSEAVAYQVDYWILRIPTLGPTIHKIALSRFAHFFAIMFQSGVPILDCLATAQKVVVNRCLVEALTGVRQSVQQGEPLSSAMEMSGQFPRLVLRMIRIGEESGNLTSTLENVTEFYDREVDDTVDGLIAMMEPGLTVVAGILMVWIIAGVLGPIYDNFSEMM